MLDLETPVGNLRMVGPSYENKLKKLNIYTVSDLLYHVPFRYEDWRFVSKISSLTPGEKVTIQGRVVEFANIYTKNRKMLQKANIEDDTGQLAVYWFNQPFLKNIIRPHCFISLCGKVDWYTNKLALISPEYEIPTTNKYIHTARLVPVYPETEGVSSKWLRSRIAVILFKLQPEIKEYLPIEIIQTHSLLPLTDAIYTIHFPPTPEIAQLARNRLAFDELLVLELAAMIRKKNWQKKKLLFNINVEKYSKEISRFINNLPFTLTSSQNNVLGEILSDLQNDIPMNRLLEGDVGSGKTVVAAIVFYVLSLNGLKSILMAPTEILATQHYQTITELLSNYSVTTQLITGKKKPQHASYDILIGTHALLYEKRDLKNTGIVVIDEQQRFGVEQRALLLDKTSNTHLLTMTATPIPRTVALTLYADLSLSVIDEMPKGRLRIKTWVVPEIKRLSAYHWIKKQIVSTLPHSQVFIVCPFIEESETLTSVKAATREFDSLKKEIFPDLKLGLLHGKLSSKKKEKVLDNFKLGKIDILISTPVVEVGIDVPQATIMVIEGAERFGLAQLHQLRGRVGRSRNQSYCLLFTENNSPLVLERLKLMEKLSDGPKLAQFDLRIRGGGDLFGTRQHGAATLKIADLSDLNLINESQKAAGEILASYNLKQFPLLHQKLRQYTIKKIAAN